MAHRSIILILMLMVTLLSQEKIARSDVPSDSLWRIEPFAIVSIHHLSETVGKTWSITPTAGVGVRVPTFVKPLHCAVTGEFGEIEGITLPYSFSTLLTTFTLEYEQRFQFNWMHLTFGAGVANALISNEDEVSVTKPFAGESENEFGATVYFEPTFSIKGARVSIRGQYRHIFSAPKPLELLSLSLVGGWRF